MPLTAARSASTVAQRTSSEFITRNGSIGQLGREVGACRDRGKAKNVVHAVKPAMARPRQPLNYLGSYAIRLFLG